YNNAYASPYCPRAQDCEKRGSDSCRKASNGSKFTARKICKYPSSVASMNSKKTLAGRKSIRKVDTHTPPRQETRCRPTANPANPTSTALVPFAASAGDTKASTLGCGKRNSRNVSP